MESNNEQIGYILNRYYNNDLEVSIYFHHEEGISCILSN